MKCQILFSRSNKKYISICRLQKILPRVVNVKPVQKGSSIIAYHSTLMNRHTETRSAIVIHYVLDRPEQTV